MLCVHFLSAKAPRRCPFLGQLQLSGLHDRFLEPFAPVSAAAWVI